MFGVWCLYQLPITNYQLPITKKTQQNKIALLGLIIYRREITRD
ncbi:hypothetical protein FDUTEX481_01259 [Tolypothrix sp. PCC 7601]|nr:hypothetical protein FDUTEX481_01259 [Tolypothrix sp. PCC 7601]